MKEIDVIRTASKLMDSLPHMNLKDKLNQDDTELIGDMLTLILDRINNNISPMEYCNDLNLMINSGVSLQQHGRASKPGKYVGYSRPIIADCQKRHGCTDDIECLVMEVLELRRVLSGIERLVDKHLTKKI